MYLTEYKQVAISCIENIYMFYHCEELNKRQKYYCRALKGINIAQRYGIGKRLMLTIVYKELQLYVLHNKIENSETSLYSCFVNNNWEYAVSTSMYNSILAVT